MAADLIREARRATLTALKADVPLIALLPAANVHPKAEPTRWPFIRWDGPSSLPIRAGCVVGATVTFYLHAFAKPLYDGTGAMIDTAEDQASRIGSAMTIAIDRRRLAVEGGLWAKMTWRGTQLLVDGGEPDAYHAVATFDARILA